MPIDIKTKMSKLVWSKDLKLLFWGVKYIESQVCSVRNFLAGCHCRNCLRFFHPEEKEVVADLLMDRFKKERLGGTN